jgi:5,10-methylenetetrahydromethanopterin reductase
VNEVELSLAFQSDKTAHDYIELAQLAEQGGFDLISVYHDLFFQPSIYPLLLMAQHTERVRLGPAAVNPFTLHPVEIAGQVAALDALSGGRAYLGLVRGAWLDAVRLEAARPLTALREAVEVVRCLLAGDVSGFAGRYFTVEPGFSLRYEPLRREIPLLIGTWGRQTAAFAAEVADEIKVGGTTNPDLIRLVRNWVGNERVGLVAGAVTVVDEDRAAARERAREEVAPYFSVVAGLDPTLDVPASLVEDVRQMLDAGERKAAGALIPDELLDRFSFAGTPEDVARQAASLFDAGASRVEFGTPHGIESRKGVKLLATKVVPHFR